MSEKSIFEIKSEKIIPGAEYTLYLLECKACGKYKRVLASPPIGHGGTLSCPVCSHYNINGPGIEQSYGLVKSSAFKIILPGLYETDLLERLAKLEHEQWVQWSRNLADCETISKKRLNRWNKLWVNYNVLKEKDKDKDRVWAKKVLGVIKNNN